MKRYYLHLYCRTASALDEEGHCLPDLDAAHAAALDGIRDCVAHDARRGIIDLGGRIDIADGHGRVLRTVGFADAFELIGAPTAAAITPRPPAPRPRPRRAGAGRG